MGMTHEAEDAVHARPIHRNRLLKWVLAGVVVLAAIVALLPSALSTGAGKRLLLAMVNDRIRGRLEASDISLSWISPVQVRGIRVTDPENREVLAVDHLAAGSSLLGVLTNWEHFRRLELDSPRVVLYMDNSGGNSLQRAFDPRQAKPEKTDKATLEPIGTITVRKGSLRIVEADGRALDVPDVALELALNTLSNVRGKIEAALGHEGRIVAEGHVASGGGGEFRLDQTTGAIEVSTPQAIDLAGPGAFLTPDANLSGKLSGVGHFGIKGGKLDATWKATAAGLAAKGKARGEVKAVDVELNGSVNREGSGGLAGHVELTGRDVGGASQTRFAHVTGDFRYGGEGAREKRLKLGDILDAVLNGRQIDLPAFSLDANGAVDIPRLAAAVPALLSVRPDVTVQTGNLRMENVVLRGGSQASAAGLVTLRDFTALRDGHKIQWEPMEARFDLAMESGQGLRVRQFHVTSGFGQLEAGGIVRGLKGTYNADLAKLTAQLGEVMDLGGLELAGQTQGNFSTNMETGRRLKVTGQSNAQSLRYRQGERKLELGKATIDLAGSVDFADPNVVRLEATRIAASADDIGKAVASGHYNAHSGAMDAAVSELDVQLAPAMRMVGQLANADLPAVEGRLVGQGITAAREDSGKAIVSGGRVNVTGLRIDGNSIGDGKAAASWEGVNLLPEKQAMTVKRAAIDANFASFTTTSFTVGYGKELAIEGDASLEADLAKMAPVIDPLLNKPGAKAKSSAVAERKDESPPLRMEGKAKWTGTARTEGRDWRLNGIATIAGFVARRGDESFREAELKVRHSVRVSPAGSTATFDSLALTSTAMDANLSGKLSDYTGTQELNLSGRYRGDWQYLTRVMHVLSPATAELTLSGPWAGDITVTGPMAAPKVRPQFRGAGGGTTVAWTSGRFAGFDLGQARIPVRLDAGRVTISGAAFPVSKGKVNLTGEIDFQSDVPALRMPGRQTVLDRVEINSEVGEKLLSRINPIFSQVASLSGNISLTTDDILMPLAPEQLSAGHGRGHVDFSELQLRPRGMLGELMSLASPGSDSPSVMRLSGLDFRIEGGVIRYENFSVTFGRDFDLIFSGAVRFDDGVDMRVSLPVRAGLMQKAGAGARSADYAGLLSDVRVEVPLVGTRGSPRMDWAKVDLASLVQRAAEAFVKKQAGKALEGKVPIPGLQGLPGLGPSKKERPPTTQPETRPKSPLGLPIRLPGLGG